MTPALYAVLGPLKGTTIELGEEELTIGRDRSNRIPIADLHLSRRHCSIKKESDDFVLSDSNSTNGVLVNGIPVRHRVLQHGDRIEFGTSLLLFVQHEDTATPATSLSNEALKAGSIVTVRWDSTPTQRTDPQELNILMRISSAIASIRDLNILGQKLLNLVVENVPCTRGAILLQQEHSKELELLCHKLKPPNQKSFRINKQIPKQAVGQKTN